jgi:hypothetical protein
MLTPLALTLVASLAHAADGPASNLLPRAGLPAARTVGVEVWGMTTTATVCAEPAMSPDGTTTFGGGCEDTMDVLGGPSLRADLPVGDRGAVELRGGWIGDEGEGVPVASAFLRVRAYGNDSVTVTPWVGGVKVLPGLFGSNFGGSAGLWAAGAAVDAGGEKVRVDLSIPVVALVEEDFETEFIPFGLPALFSEAGVRVQIAPGHSLRAGTASLAPGVSWRGEFEKASVEVAIHGVYDVVLARASVAKTF